MPNPSRHRIAATRPEAAAVEIVVEDDRTGMSREALRRAVLDHLKFTRGKDLHSAQYIDVFHAVAHAVRDRLVHRWMRSTRTYAEKDARRIYYFSAEYLPGRQLAHNLINLELYDIAREELDRFGISLEEVLEQEPDPGLGNGGLGRLAACFMDSLATLELPAWGYGIRYEFGIFRQMIEDGWQVEQPDEWLHSGNPWEIRRPEFTVEVRFGGRIETFHEPDGRVRHAWVEGETVLGVPYDTPIAGFGTPTVNTLRLWQARASEQFDLTVFNDGDYRRAVEQKAISESISKVLYPKDNSPQGKALRLKQQYFFVACALHDLVRRYKATHPEGLGGFADKVAIQLNDTHPAITVAELMRILVDVEGMEWEEAWAITRRVCAYTNHTLLPEALERWSLPLFEELLPRHLQIIYEINHLFLREVHVRFPGDPDRKRRMSIIEESQPKHIRMANLAVIGAWRVNGVAALHSQLLKEVVLSDFADLWPERFTNMTNGVTPRRWLVQCNRRLADLALEQLGDKAWVTDLGRLGALEALGTDPGFIEKIAAIKRANKVDLAAWLAENRGISIDPDSLFDVQVKRIHEYKRQLMLALHVVHLYRKIKVEGAEIVPRTVIFGGKAAPGYVRAKQFIKFIHDVGQIVNSDPDCQGRLALHFLPNYNVSLAERIIPATDLSEQISLAGMEASGTGNMKFQMNGALTIGTLDGANIEIREAVGVEHFFAFGMSAEEVRVRREEGYDPAACVEESVALSSALDLVERGFFAHEDLSLHKEIATHLRLEDPYMICADFDSYVAAQEEAAARWTRPEEWWRSTLVNIARSGRFSSDRTIEQYADQIWGLKRMRIEME